MKWFKRYSCTKVINLLILYCISSCKEIWINLTMFLLESFKFIYSLLYLKLELQEGTQRNKKKINIETLCFMEYTRHLLSQCQQWKHKKKVRYLFQFNNKDIRAMSITSFWCFYYWLWREFAHYFGISFINFKHVISGREMR